MERRRRRSSPLGAVLLILVGGILLLNVLGVLEWSIWWSLIRLWPLLLIAAGLELLLGRTRLGALLVTVLVLAMGAFALWLIATGAIGGNLVAEQIGQPLGDNTSASVLIEPVVGTLRVDAAAEPASLVEGTVHLGKGEEIRESFADAGGAATYALSVESGGWNTFPGGWDQTRVWELGLSPGAELSVKVDMAVGDCDLDLSGLVVEDVTAEMGMGRIMVTLPATGQYELSLTQGLGVVEIVIPKGMAVRITADTAMAGRRMPDDLVKDEEVYASPGYAAAANRAEIDASVAMGMLTVRYQQ